MKRVGIKTLVTALIIICGAILFSHIEFAAPLVPQDRYEGICSETCTVTLMSGWFLFLALSLGYMFMDPKTGKFKQKYIEHFSLTMLYIAIGLLVTLPVLGFILTGKLCLFLNRACLN